MKRAVVLVVVLALLAFPATVYGVGATKHNASSIELRPNLTIEIDKVIIPGPYSNAGRTLAKIIGHPRVFKIDLNWDGTLNFGVMWARGQGFEIVYFHVGYEDYCNSMLIDLAR